MKKTQAKGFYWGGFKDTYELSIENQKSNLEERISEFYKSRNAIKTSKDELHFVRGSKFWTFFNLGSELLPYQTIRISIEDGKVLITNEIIGGLLWFRTPPCQLEEEAVDLEKFLSGEVAANLDPKRRIKSFLMLGLIQCLVGFVSLICAAFIFMILFFLIYDPLDHFSSESRRALEEIPLPAKPMENSASKTNVFPDASQLTAFKQDETSQALQHPTPNRIQPSSEKISAGFGFGRKDLPRNKVGSGELNPQIKTNRVN